MKAFFTSAKLALVVFLPTLKTGSGMRLGRSLDDIYIFESIGRNKDKNIIKP